MNTRTLDLYRKYRANPGMIWVGHAAESALSNARTHARFEQLESRDVVRLRAEYEEENYFDVFGTQDDEREQKRMEDYLENHPPMWCVSEVLIDGEWEPADSIGMCSYDDALDSFENCYITDLMSAAVEMYDDNNIQLDLFESVA